MCSSRSLEECKFRKSYIPVCLIIVEISDTTNRFRWVSLQISWLCGSRSSRVARKRLNELSEGLEESYQRVYTQILALDQDDSAMARKAISWLLCGKRHLSTSEFITAVCLDTDTTPAKIRDLITKETLLDLCQNLVVLDKELDIFRVAHLSVREFFERKDGFGKHDVSAVALDVCIAALVNDAGLGTWDFTGSFKFYAQVYWPDHCEGLGPQGPPEPLRSKVKSFLLEGQVASSAFTKWTDDVKLRLPRLSDLQIRKIGDVSRLLEMPLYPVCACGMLWLAKDASLQHVNWSFQKANHDNGIIVAALWGHHSMVEFLLQRGVPVDSRGVENRTALHVAASHGRKKVAMILLERDADINARQEGSAKGVWPVSPPGATALHEAASNGHLELVECLLRSGANIEASNGRRETPLFGAVRKDLNVTRYLLDRGAQINVKAERDDTVLHAAAYAAAESHNLKEIVVLLLARSADISAVRDDGITPLHWAAKSEIILSVFLAKMAQSDLQRSWMGTSLIQAVQSHSLDSITLLLERGININSMETSGKRPLDYALELGSPQILSTLLAHKAKPGLAWNIASTYIQEGKNYPWFSGLVEIILRGDIPQLWLQRFPHILGAREEEKVVTQSSPDLPYLEVLIPHELDDVQGIIFYIESHDQGQSLNLMAQSIKF